VEDGIYGGLAHRHGYVGYCVFVESGACGEVLSCLLYRVDALERRA
jgi:hypothetical protein